MPEPTVDRRDVETALEARRELGREYEPQIVDSFVERIERRLEDRAKPAVRNQSGRHGAFTLAMITLAAAIPITAIAATHGGIVAMIVIWAGLVAVNAVYNR